MNIYDQMNQKTKLLIEQSFLELLAHREFNKISIRDITEAAKINRGTFYLHFENKYDLLASIEQNLLEGLEKASIELEPDEVLEEAREGRLSHFSMQVFRFIDSNASQFKVLLSHNNQSGFIKRLQHLFVNQFALKYKNHQLTNSYLELPSHYMAAFAASAFMGVIEEWLKTRDHEPPEQIAEYFVRIILMIQNYSKNA